MHTNWLYPQARLLLMAKAPIAHYCKTRLQPSLSAAQSAHLQTKFIEHAVATLQQTALAPVEIWCAPDCSHPVFQSISQCSNLTLHTQEGQNLGEKMQNSIGTPHQVTLLMGTDCPSINALHLRTLLDAVHSHYDVAIMPANDGGYVAIALRTKLSALFDNIPWGTSKVFAKTQQAAEQLQCKLFIGPTLSDVDTYQDYREMCKKMPNMAV